MNTVQLTIKANEEEQEILISQLADHNAIGFEQTEEHLIAYFPENDFDSYEISSILKKNEFIIQTVKEQNWNAVWEENFQPVVVDDFCGVRAHFHEPIKGVEHEILITPKMSFGTGHHATTFMMMRQMRDLDFSGKKIFDFGTGTGILAILAEKLGASSVDAIDVDNWSIENSIENAEKNGSSVINFKLSTELPPVAYDGVLANINRNVILQYLPQLRKLVRPQGWLLLSGLLVSDEGDIVKACIEQGFVFRRKEERNNWISLLFVNE